MPHIFKIWSGDRSQKAFVMATDTEPDLYTQIVLKASTKLKIDGSRIVLNSDGTPIDDDEILIAFKQETLLLLQKNESWISEKTNSNHNSLATTVSVSKAAVVEDWLNNEVPDVPIDLVTPEEQVEEINGTKIVNLEIINLNVDYLWSTFEIPWNKMSQDILLMCEQGKNNKATISDIVHIVVNELRDIKDSIPAKVLKSVANKMMAKYPNTFRDVDDDGLPVGDGSSALFCKLYERASYLRRPHKRGHSNDISVPPQLKKKKLNVMAGCSHWAPRSQDLTGAEDYKNRLNGITEETSEEELNDLMENTYPEQRLFLNDIKNPPSVDHILAEWPVLLTNQRCMNWHFNKLTGAKLENLSSNILSKCQKIKTFAIKKKLIFTNNDLTNDMELVLEILAKHFKENIKHFFCVYKDLSDRSNNLLGNAPFIKKIENNENSAENSYEVYFERKKVFETHIFLDAVTVTFALYFILNLEYPKEISTLLEMMQRYFLKIHPDNGSKSKKMTLSKKKVISLIKQLND